MLLLMGPPRRPFSTQTQTHRCSVQAPALGSDERPDSGPSAGLPPTWPARGEQFLPPWSSDFPELFSQPESYSLSRKRETRFAGPARH